jgi:hypothetical protein
LTSSLEYVEYVNLATRVKNKRFPKLWVKTAFNLYSPALDSVGFSLLPLNDTSNHPANAPTSAYGANNRKKQAAH